MKTLNRAEFNFNTRQSEKEGCSFYPFVVIELDMKSGGNLICSLGYCSLR